MYLVEVEIVEGKGAVLGVNVGHPIVINWDFVALVFSAVKGGDAALPKLFWGFLFIDVTNFLITQYTIN